VTADEVKALNVKDNGTCCIYSTSDYARTRMGKAEHEAMLLQRRSAGGLDDESEARAKKRLAKR